MTAIRVKGFQIFRDRHGRWRCYHRATRTSVDLLKAPIGTPEFFAECARIGALSTAAGPPKPGTLGLLIRDYRASPAFADLAPRTRTDYQRIFDYLRPIADTELVRFSKPLVIRIRDRAAAKHGRRFGNYVKSVLSLLFSWGAERGFLPNNPAEGIKAIRRDPSLPRANRPWSDEERFAVLAAAPVQLKVPLAIGMFTGLREGDVLRLTKADCSGARLATRTGKTGRLITWPRIPAALLAILAEAPAHDAVTVAATSRGRPWTAAGFRASWRNLRLKLEAAGLVAPGLTFHGLRHTVGTILAEEGFDDRTIADVLGQSTDRMARHYSRDADRARKMVGVVRKLDLAENKRRARLSNRLPETVKPDRSGE